MTRELLKQLPPLTAEDLEDPAWVFAKIVVAGNHERHIINQTLAKLWAREHNVPLLYYDTQCRDSTRVLDTEADLKERERIGKHLPGMRRRRHRNSETVSHVLRALGYVVRRISVSADTSLPGCLRSYFVVPTSVRRFAAVRSSTPRVRTGTSLHLNTIDLCSGEQRGFDARPIKYR